MKTGFLDGLKIPSVLGLMVFFLWLIGLVAFKPLCVVGAILLPIASINNSTFVRAPKLICGVYVTSLILAPELGQLGVLLGAVLLCMGNPRVAIGVLAATTCTNICMPIDWPVQAITAFAGLIPIILAHLWEPSALRRLTAGFLLLAGVTGLISQHSIPTIYRTASDASGVSYGDALERVTGGEMAKGGVVYLEGIGNNVVPPPPTVVAEHDARIPPDTGLSVIGNYKQPRPWSWNQPSGSEVMRFWAACDGAIITNVGAKVQGNGKLFLGVATFSGVIPIVVNGSSTVISDSDMLLDFLAPYSPRTLSYLVNANSLERWMGFIYNALCLFLGLFVLRAKATSQLLICVALALAGVLRATLADKFESGDVRLVGIRKGWPHDSSAYGVPRALNREGYRFKIGTVGAKVLCIGPGASANLYGETLVVLSPGAHVHLPNGCVVYSGDEPMGDTGGVLDARAIFSGESTTPSAIGEMKSEGVTFVASGSAGKLNGWSRFLGGAKK